MAEDDIDGGVGVCVWDDYFGADGGREALFALGVEGRPEGRETASFEGDGFYGIPLSKWLPYVITRTWHTQLGIFWIATAWLAAGLFVAPSIGGGDPKGQALGVYVLLGALVLVVVGAAAAGGRVAAAIASAAAALSFNFMHAAPLYTFHLRNTADVVSSVLMILVGIAVGEVAVRRFRTAWQGSSAPREGKR